MTTPRYIWQSLLSRCTFALILCATACTPSADADRGSDSVAEAEIDDGATQVIRRVVDQVFDILRDPALQPIDKRRERMSAIRGVADQVFDWQLMAQRSLGVHWRGLDDGQKARFLSAFKELLSDRYMDDMDKFRGTEEVIVDGARRVGERCEVETTLITHSRERVPIHYFLYQNGSRWLVDDVSIEGVSLVNHYRGTFHRYLVNRSIEQLLTRLEAKRGGAR